MKMSTFNFIQTPLGADRVSITGELSLTQREAYQTGSVKRIVDYDTDNLAVYL